MVVTVGEGGGMFVVDQESGKFLWANPFPYDDPNINMNDIDLKTGRTRVNPDKLFKKDGDKILGCYHNTRGTLVDRLSAPRTTRSTFRSRTSACP